MRSLWHDAGGDGRALDALHVTGPRHVLPSCFDVTEAATAVVSAMTLAGASLLATRNGETIRPVTLDRLHAAIACRSEHHLECPTPLSAGDPLFGDHRCADGWIRIHTNYDHHRQAALTTLGVPEDRDAYVEAIARWKGEELETAVVDHGGAAAFMRTHAQWDAHPHGAGVRALPLVGIEDADGPSDPPEWCRAGTVARPLDGVRVLDVTRVIAGPTATKMLAAHGATVVRVEPPGFEEVPLLSVDTGFGKRRVALDLRAAGDRAAYESLVRGAHVVVSGFRPGALAALGYDDDALRALQPSLVTASLSAWGTAGPWAPRRGFDSLVQMASGIAAAGMQAAHADRPVPLPCQFLDHGSAYLLAFGVLRALERQARGAGPASVRVALARTAAWLIDLGPVDALGVTLPDETTVDRYRATLPSTWGDLRYVRPPGAIDGAAPHWDTAPQPAGSAAAAW